MFAVVKIAGQQFKVTKDQTLYVPRLEGKAGDKIDITEILLTDNDGKLSIGDAIKAAAQAYNINVNSSKDQLNMAKQLGMNISAADINKKAAMKNVIEIVAGADQRWGAGAAQ